MRFGTGRELRTFHADIGAALMHGAASLARGGGQRLRPRRAYRIGVADVRDDAVTEERAATLHGAVDELIGNHEVPGCDLLAQAAHRTHAEQALDAELLH